MHNKAWLMKCKANCKCIRVYFLLTICFRDSHGDLDDQVTIEKITKQVIKADLFQNQDVSHGTIYFNVHSSENHENQIVKWQFTTTPISIKQ